MIIFPVKEVCYVWFPIYISLSRCLRFAGKRRSGAVIQKMKKNNKITTKLFVVGVLLFGLSARVLIAVTASRVNVFINTAIIHYE